MSFQTHHKHSLIFCIQGNSNKYSMCNFNQIASNLKYNFCVILNKSDETKTNNSKEQTQQNNLQINQDLLNSKQNDKKDHLQPGQYINYTKIYEQNKRRLKLISSGINANQLNQLKTSISKQQLFNEQYLRTELLANKYFYTDIVTISSYVIQYLMNKIDSQPANLTTSQTPIVTITHAHFLLYVYHLYIKEFKTFKQQLFVIIGHFINSQIQKKQFQISKNLQLFVYLRKFIDFQIVFGNGSRVVNLTDKYCWFLKQSYIKQKNQLTQDLNSQINHNKSFTKRTIIKAKLLENYLLSHPSLWISTFNNNQKYVNAQLIKNYKNQVQTSNYSSQSKFNQNIIQTYGYFVQQFSSLFNNSIKYWLNSENQQPTDSNSINISSKKSLIEEFKQKQLNKCYNSLRLVTHRLWAIIQIPRLSPTQSTQSNLKKSNDKQLQNQYLNMIKKYQTEKINILKYLPSQKFNLNQDICFIKLLILMKNLFGYQTLKQIDHQQLTIFLQKLFENNKQLINSKNKQKRRQIKFLLGELISRLTSGLWADAEDVLGKYFEPSTIKNQLYHKGKRDNLGEWFE